MVPILLLRAILKAADICTTDPERAAGFIASRGYTGARDYAAQALREIPHARWHEYDPEDTVRFYALRLHEVGMLKSSPQKLIAQGTDWRFLNELKKELSYFRFKFLHWQFCDTVPHFLRLHAMCCPERLPVLS